MGQQKEAAVLGMWLFLLTEILFFGGLFMAYLVYRTWYFDAFAEASRDARDLLGRAQHRGADRQLADDGAGRAGGADQQAERAPSNWLILTMVLGAVFLGVKVIEYKDKFEHHHVPGASFVWAQKARGRGRGAPRSRAAAANGAS